MPASNVLTHRAEPDDRATVLSLLAEYLPDEDVEKRHTWLYEQNPHGRALTIVAYEPETREPMGLTSLFPRRVRVDREVHLGSIGGDGFVRPKFRRRGVATALHRTCLEAMSDASIEFMFGAPEPTNLGALLKAGSRAVARLRRYARPRAVQSTLRTFGKLWSRTRAELVPLDSGDPRAGELWASVSESEDDRVTPVRDAEHYAWRFGDTPAATQHAFLVVEGGRAIAACALERRGGVVAVLDLVAPRDRRMEALRAIADASNAETLTLLTNDESPEARALWQAGFIPREAKTFQVLAPWQASFAGSLQDPRRWFYFWGDGDVDRIL